MTNPSLVENIRLGQQFESLSTMQKYLNQQREKQAGRFAYCVEFPDFTSPQTKTIIDRPSDSRYQSTTHELKATAEKHR